jgi:cold shock CspA family protein
MKGRVTRFKDFNGYGFAAGEDGNEYFLHVTEIRTSGFKTLAEGQEIDFTPSKSHKGFVARDIIPMSLDISALEKQPNLSVPTIMRDNPFTPQEPMINPRKFVGRKECIESAIYALFNGKNILIDGYRGIGKSSVALQLLFATQGEIELLDKLGIKFAGKPFNNVTGDYRCLPNSNLADIISGLITTLQIYLGKYTKTKSSQNSVELDAKILSVKHLSETEPLSPSDLSVWFVAESKKLLKDNAYGAQGITFLIDEIDVLFDKVDLASFLKATIEKFRADSYFSVNFIVSGVTGTATELIIQHPSSERLFEHLEIPRMNNQELSGIIDAALVDSGVTIEDEAKRRITRLSNDFPYPVHLLGYHSFRIDSDNIIDIPDVEKAIRFITTLLSINEMGHFLNRTF